MKKWCLLAALPDLPTSSKIGVGPQTWLLLEEGGRSSSPNYGQHLGEGPMISVHVPRSLPNPCQGVAMVALGPAPSELSVPGQVPPLFGCRVTSQLTQTPSPYLDSLQVDVQTIE